jgi:hypothetical protein
MKGWISLKEENILHDDTSYGGKEPITYRHSFFILEEVSLKLL